AVARKKTGVVRGSDQNASPGRAGSTGGGSRLEGDKGKAEGQPGEAPGEGSRTRVAGAKGHGRGRDRVRDRSSSGVGAKDPKDGRPSPQKRPRHGGRSVAVAAVATAVEETEQPSGVPTAAAKESPAARSPTSASSLGAEGSLSEGVKGMGKGRKTKAPPASKHRVSRLSKTLVTKGKVGSLPLPSEPTAVKGQRTRVGQAGGKIRGRGRGRDKPIDS
ncbi:unnamed protein product, partial [Discosporangium mesarthrocarpum]